MPRPSNGYTNAAGKPIPGTHDPISRYMDKSALMHWAYKRGTEGLPMYDRSAIDIGSTVHGMAELDLRGRADREIEGYANDRLTAPDHLHKCWSAFEAFRDWRSQCHVRAIAQEVSLVSEAHQYGGTPDTIAMFGNGGLGLIDFKTSAKPYPDHLLALAAHGNLWNEHHPDQPIKSYHLLILPKDGSGFQEYAYTDLTLQWKLFRLYLDAYRLDKAAAQVASATVKKTTAAAASPKKRTTKPRIAAATMAELLRAYKHVPGVAAC